MSPENTLKLLQARAFERTSSACVILDETSSVLAVNRAAEKIFGAEPASGQLNLEQYIGNIINAASILALAKRGLHGESLCLRTSFETGQREYHGTLRIVPVLESKKEGRHWVLLFFDDMSTYIRLQRRMTQDEFFDRQTGLLNRKTLDIMLELEIEKSSRKPKDARLAVLLIHVPNLGQLQSVYDSSVLHHILEHLGNSVKIALRSNDLVFRYDESHLLALVTNYALKTDLLIVAERVADQVAIPFSTSDATIHLQSAMGIALYPDDGVSCDSLLGNAATALAHALEASAPWLMYNQEIHNKAMDRLYLRSALSEAVKKNQLELRYMNLVDADGKTRGLEALVRWQHPTRGLLGPEAFLPIAIHSRIISSISRWVLYRILKDWDDTIASTGLFVSFNISGQDFSDPYLSETISSAIKNRMPAGMLKIEITESESIEHYDLAIKAMHELNTAGIEIFIDDFGVGLSSLTYLKDLPVQWAKIDRSFIEKVNDSEMEFRFLTHIISLGKVRGLKVLVEGIETEAQFRLLRSAGPDLFQGHYFGEPRSLEQILKGLRNKE